MAQKAKALTTAQMVEMWTRAAGAAETSLADLAAAMVKDMALTKSDLPFLSRPKGEAKQNNRHVTVFDGIESILQENIVVKGERITPATVAALRDKNVEGTSLLQGIPKSVSALTCWVGQIKVRIRTLRGAVERHLEAGAEKTSTRTDKTHPEFMRERLQAMFNRANKAEDFDLADMATFNAWVEQGAKMMGIKIAKAKCQRAGRRKPPHPSTLERKRYEIHGSPQTRRRTYSQGWIASASGR